MRDGRVSIQDGLNNSRFFTLLDFEEEMHIYRVTLRLYSTHLFKLRKN